MLGDAEAVIDRRIAALGVKPCGAAHEVRIDAGDGFHGFRRALVLCDEGGPVLELGPVATLLDEGLVHQTFGDDHMGDRRQHGDIGAGLQWQMDIGLHMGRAHEIDAARIDDDQLGALAQPLLHA